MERAEVYEIIRKTAEEITPKLIDYRHDFHKYAEGGWLEIRTGSLIARRLYEMGYEVLIGGAVMKPDVRMNLYSEEFFEKEYERAIEQGADPEFAPYMKYGMTGVIGILRGGQREPSPRVLTTAEEAHKDMENDIAPVIGMRFDIDALGIPESTDPEHQPVKCGYASVNDGFMHACGHDSHACIGLGTAEILMKIRDELKGTVKLIFQPHEEGVAGAAEAIVANGHLDKAMYLISSHSTKQINEPDDAVLYPGVHGMLATSKWGVVMHGRSAHAGGSPEKGHDALLATATCILEMNAIPRHSGGISRVGVGKVRDDSVINAISDEVHFDFEVRGQTNEICQYMERKAKLVLEHAAAMHECTYDLVRKGGGENFTSSEGLMKRVRRVCEQDLGMKLTEIDSMKGSGSEDVSYMINKVISNGGEGTFMRILTDIEDIAHSRSYNINDEKLLTNGAEAFAGVVYDICAEKGDTL